MATELSDRTELEHDVAFERFHAALMGEPGRYPRGAHFVSAEAPWAMKVLSRHIREATPVVLVYPDGEERVLEIGRPGGPVPFGSMAIANVMRRMKLFLRDL